MKDLKNLLKESVINESKLDTSETYNQPIGAIVNMQTGTTGVLIGGLFKSNDTTAISKAERLIKQLGYSIGTSMEDYFEISSNSYAKNTQFAYIVSNDETEAHAAAIGKDDIYILNSIN